MRHPILLSACIAGVLAVVGEQAGGIAVAALVDRLDGGVEIGHVHDRKHGSKNFIARDRHIGCDAIENGGTDE